ncbi:MAG: S8 family serine peptidase, partial [Chloroflexales bacterium]|nr:S8 family serine peptidase [Chloroflexales bacterium]
MLRLTRLPRPLLYALIVAAMLGLSTSLSRPSEAAQPQPPAEAAHTDQIIVAFRPASDTAAQAAAQPDQVAGMLSADAGTTLDYLRPLAEHAHVLRLDSLRPYAEIKAIAKQIAARPDVLYAEPDAIVFPTLTPNDPGYSFTYSWNIWPLAADNYGANLPSAWDITTGSASVGVAVIDSGGLLGHEDLAGRTRPGNPGYDMISNTFIANDGDSRDADPSDPGDWVTPAEVRPGCGSSPSSWHGSHVAGTIGASANNSIGVAGINWVSPLLFMRAIGKCGGYSSDIIDSIRWASGLTVAGLPLNPNPARVINMSLGFSDPSTTTCDNSIQEAVSAATAAGTVIVVAAGNEGVNAANTQPANCAGVITVAASRRDGGRASYSNFGATVEIAAPGGEESEGYMIWSTVNAGTTIPTVDAYGGYAGTSMAAPHVTGVASLMLSVNPALTPDQVRQILQSTATPFPAGSTCSGQCGAGIVNAGAAVDEAARRVRTVGYGSASQTISETAGAVSVPVTLSLASDKAIAVPYTVSGTATGADHSLTSGTLSIPAGQKSASLSFSLTDDAVVDPDETIVITLGTPTGAPTPATLAEPSVHTITIRDDESPEGQLSPASLGFGDQQLSTTSAAKAATLTNISSQPLAISDIAVTGADFARSGGTCATTFPTTLAAGDSCTILVTFTPTAAGARSGGLSAVTDGAGSDYSVALAGQGLRGLLS